MREITELELKTHESKLRVDVDGISVDPYPYAKLTDKLSIYMAEVFGIQSAFYKHNPEKNSYYIYNRSTSDPKIMMEWLKMQAEIKNNPNSPDYFEHLLTNNKE